MRILVPLVVVLIGAAPFVAQAEDEPSATALHEGKPASHWISELKKDDSSARRKAVYALFKLGSSSKAAVPLLARAFEDDDEYVRDTAYKALVALKEDARPAIKALRSALNDGRERVRQLAMWALLRIDPPTVFRDEDFDVRKAALMAVVEGTDFFNELVFGELLARTLDEDGEIRTWAARALANAYSSYGLDRPYLIPVKARLAKLLCHMAAQDDDALARQAAAYSLGFLAHYPKGRDLSERIRPTLIAATRDESPEVRSEAFMSLSATGKSEEAAKACLVGVKDKHASVRARACGGLASVSEGGPHVVAALIRLLADEDRSVRSIAARSLGWFAEKSAGAVPALTARLLVETRPGEIAKALGDIGPAARPALPQLEAAFAASKESSAELAYALLRLGTPNREAVLKRLVDVALSDVGGRAQAYLGTLGATAAPAVPRIVEALAKGRPRAEGRPSERVSAAWTLRAMGPVATAAVPALEALLKDGATTDELLTEAARDALKAIRGQ